MRTVFLVLILCVFPAGVFSQEKAELITEFGPVPCGHFMANAGSILWMHQNSPGSKIYVIYYEGRYAKLSVWNKRTKKNEEKLTGPARGEALNYAKGIGLYLGNAYKFDTGNIVLIDGGFMESMSIALWIVPPGAEPPKPAPTVDEKDVVFRKGKPRPPRDCSHAYDHL